MAKTHNIFLMKLLYGTKTCKFYHKNVILNYLINEYNRRKKCIYTKLNIISSIATVNYHCT